MSVHKTKTSPPLGKENSYRRGVSSPAGIPLARIDPSAMILREDPPDRSLPPTPPPTLPRTVCCRRSCFSATATAHLRLWAGGRPPTNPFPSRHLANPCSAFLTVPGPVWLFAEAGGPVLRFLARACARGARISPELNPIGRSRSGPVRSANFLRARNPGCSTLSAEGQTDRKFPLLCHQRPVGEIFCERSPLVAVSLLLRRRG